MRNYNGNKNESDLYVCPICGAILREVGIKYKTEELFNFWNDVVFSEKTKEEHYKQANHTSLYKCGDCDFEIFFPQIIGSPDFYLELQEFIHPFYTDKWEFEVARNDVKRNDKVVDIGCGQGIFLKKINGIASRVIGIEYNQQALNIAKENGLEVFGSEEDLSDLRGKVDTIFCFHVLEHVKDPMEFIKYLCIFLVDGGRIGISVPDMNGPVKFTDPNKWNIPPHHATRWNIKSLEKLAYKLGLIIESIKYEPLSYGSSNYYSVYWVNKNIRFSNAIRIVMSKTLMALFWILFGILGVFNKKYINMLRGQSIYILLKKPL
jgi:2-polyprenyl-3-methyl-5-hydroxy-6-metoxy-1,4-benzoquinol methylase